ncbi:MAG TPA: RluA family pseudouridine synthase [Actinomycetota bacterium]
MPREVEFIADGGDEGRLDAVLAARAGISRAHAARLIAAGAVRADGRPAPKSLRVRPGMRILAVVPDEPGPPQAEEIPLRVVHEDDALLVVAKPAGLVVHPAPGHRSGTLVNALLARSGLPAGGASDRPGIVHRLDAGTSGLMIVAKSEDAHAALVRAMARRRITRVYLALAEGVIEPDTMTIDAPIGRSTRQRKKMAVVAGGREAITRIMVMQRLAEATFVEARPETGRTHQIRVHLAASGHAVVGDDVYGRDRQLADRLDLKRPFLHATRLVFAHPVTGETIDLSEPLPSELERALAVARASGGGMMEP